MTGTVEAANSIFIGSGAVVDVENGASMIANAVFSNDGTINTALVSPGNGGGGGSQYGDGSGGRR